MIPQGVPSVLADEYLRRAAVICADAEQVAGRLSEAQLHWNPPDGGWSVAQVLEHLLITNGFYIPKMNALVTGTVPDASPRPWKPSFFGKLIIKAIDPANRGKTSAPKIFRPTLAPRPGVLAAFLNQMAEYRTVLVRGSRADWNRIRLSSPVAAIIRVNLGDAYTTIILHCERHVGQARRVIDRFPS